MKTYPNYLRCPITLSELQPAGNELIASINEQIASGQVRNRVDRAVDRPLDGGLINADMSWLYPVWNDIPTLVPDEAIKIPQVSN